MTVTDEGQQERKVPVAAGRARPRWWQRPWVVPLALVTVIFLGFSVPRYVTLDPERALLGVNESFPLFYPLLVTHIFAGSVALLAVCLQVWPWLRRHHPAVHRWSGRTYVMVGVPFVGVPALVIAPFSTSGFGTQVSNTLWGVLWLGCTIAGYRMARQRRYAEHRVWMLRSFALIFAIVVNRPWVAVVMVALMPQLDTTFGGDMDALVMVAAATSSWLSWVVNLLVVEWWIQYRRRGRAGGGPRRGQMSTMGAER